MLLTIVFMPLMHPVPGNPLLCGISGDKPLDSFLCGFASLQVIWRDVEVSEEQALEPASDSCEKELEQYVANGLQGEGTVSW